MDSFQEAFLKAGIVDSGDIKRIKKEKIKEEKTEKIIQKKIQKNKQYPQRVHKNIPKLDKEEYKVFNQMMQDHKRRKFLLHLIHAFLPNLKENHVDYIWSWSDVKGERRCVICDQLLISLGDAYIRAKKEIDENFKRITIITQETNHNIFEHTNQNLDKVLQQFFPEQSEYMAAFNNKVAGIHSANSKAFICAPCYKLLNNWVFYMLLIGNRDINYILGKSINNPFYQK